ncbi:MAG: replication-associated recombination protein A [Candidatus Kapaibacterium sp.]
MNAQQTSPLAARIRPRVLSEVLGQEHLLGPGKPMRRMIETGRLHSMILWGPPGVGKTTIALLLAEETKALFRRLSAVSSGIKEVREVIAEGKEQVAVGKSIVLFLDEIHRFNKAQQDALLPAVEEGWITLIGATTENPSFEVIRPLLSRCTVFTLNPLSTEALNALLERATDLEPRLQEVEIVDRELLTGLSGGDGRKLLTGLELALDLLQPKEKSITGDHLRTAFSSKQFYDKTGEAHYDIISAFIKSIRGSDPNGALFWLARMLEGGEDPLFIARRMVILASEDIGNADPYAITLATNIFLALERIGMPEGRIILAQGVTYLATALKSNASYKAIDMAVKDARQHPHLFPPLHLRNAPTGLMKSLGYGKNYRYAHNYEGGFIDQEYLPDELQSRVYYQPSRHGREGTILERLKELWPKRYGKK